MSSKFGKKVTVSVFGQSHGRAVGAVVEGFPVGEAIDMALLRAFMERRAGGRSDLTTKRREADLLVFLSGIKDGKTCGFPLAFLIENQDVRSMDYDAVKNIPRPGHADYAAFVKYGTQADMRGGGHFSGRLTAPLCGAGGIALQILRRRGIVIGAHLFSVGLARDRAFDGVSMTAEEVLTPGRREFPTVDAEAAEAMKKEIREAAAQLDSVGGSIECAVLGLPAGLGEPMFDGLENQLAAALFGIPAIKGVEFGAGFAAASMRGSQNNDAYEIREDGRVGTTTNHHGGALGGISTGMPVVLRVAVKPTPSIAQKQSSVNLQTMEAAFLEIKGRHDPCVALRAVPCVEAVVALVLLDLLEQSGAH